MPNWTYLTLHFVHTLALGLWIGGTLVSWLLAAALRRELDSPRAVSRALARVDLHFERLLLGCIGALAVTSVLMVLWYGRLSPWYAVEYVCIAMMSASALYAIFVAGPRRRRLEAAWAVDPEVQRLDRATATASQFHLACASVALYFS